MFLWEFGDKVIVGGYGIGEEAWGGFSSFARLCADWLVVLPLFLIPCQAMVIGIVGLMVMEVVIVLEEYGFVFDDGEVLVMGAGGGVGSIVVVVFVVLGY